MPNFFTNVGRANVWPTIQSGLQTADQLKTSELARRRAEQEMAFSLEDQERKKTDWGRVDEQYQHYLDVVRPAQDAITGINLDVARERYIKGEGTLAGSAGVLGGSSLPSGLTGDRIGGGNTAIAVAPSKGGTATSRSARPVVVPSATASPMFAASPEALEKAREDALVKEKLKEPWDTNDPNDDFLSQFGSAESKERVKKVLRDRNLIDQNGVGSRLTKNQVMFMYYSDQGFGDEIDKIYVEGARADAAAWQNEVMTAREKHMKASASQKDVAYGAVREAETKAKEAQDKYTDAIASTNESVAIRKTITALDAYAKSEGTTADKLAAKYPFLWTAANSGKADLLEKAMEKVVAAQNLEKEQAQAKAEYDAYEQKMRDMAASGDKFAKEFLSLLATHPGATPNYKTGKYKAANDAIKEIYALIKAREANETALQKVIEAERSREQKALGKEVQQAEKTYRDNMRRVSDLEKIGKLEELAPEQQAEYQKRMDENDALAEQYREIDAKFGHSKIRQHRERVQAFHNKLADLHAQWVPGRNDQDYVNAVYMTIQRANALGLTKMTYDQWEGALPKGTFFGRGGRNYPTVRPNIPTQ